LSGTNGAHRPGRGSRAPANGTTDQDPVGRALTAARQLAQSGGYDAVQMREVVRLTGLSSATIYRLFSSKDHLIAVAHLEWVNEWVSNLDVKPVSGQGADAVAEIIHRTSVALARSDGIGAATIRALASSDPNVHLVQEQAKEASFTIIRQMVADLLPDPDEYVELLGFAWRGGLDSWASGRADMNHVDQRLQRLSRLLLAGSLADATRSAL
jgi:AcrR family transcriptional regulator